MFRESKGGSKELSVETKLGLGQTIYWKRGNGAPFSQTYNPQFVYVVDREGAYKREIGRYLLACRGKAHVQCFGVLPAPKEERKGGLRVFRVVDISNKVVNRHGTDPTRSN